MGDLINCTMGGSLPTAVLSTNVETKCTPHFRVGAAEMNGWRTSMEDSHLIWTHNHDKGCFGVLDGHGGDECAEWCAKRIWQKLEAAADLPKDDDAAKTLMLQVDAEFLAGDEEGFVDDSGATATMCAVRVLAGGRKFA